MGKEEEVTPGEKGKVTITTSYDKDQNKLVTKEETKDPVKRVVKVGIKPVVTTEPIPFEKEFEHDPSLEAGKIELISEGKPGTATSTTTFNKETGKLETSVTRTKPTNAKYKYGSKTEGKVKVTSDIPYEVEFVPDGTMAAGETKVEQEGKLGEKETTITIKNSKEESREEKILEEPVKKIVKIGTLCKVPTPNPGDKPNEPGTPSNPGDKPNEPSTPGNPGDKPNEPGTPGNPGDKPNEPGTPGNPGDKPNEPGTPDNPGDKPNEPGMPGNSGDKPNEPGTPSNPGDKPSEPGTPSNPGGNNPSHPGNPGGNNPSNPSNPVNPDKSEGSVPNKASQKDEEGGSRRATPSSLEQAKVSDDAKAPQTFDPGVAAPAGLAALASGLLVGLERLKRRKRD